jgi:leukotriene-A4 hydrolase
VAPLQDTPAIKATYAANVTVKDPYVVKMSGMELSKTIQVGNFSTYHFYQNIKIPSYLIAIAVGNLEEKRVGD